MLTWRPENLLKTLVNIAKCLRAASLKNTSESVNHTGSCFFEFQVKHYRTVEYRNRVGMWIWYKLISLKKTAYLLVSQGMSVSQQLHLGHLFPHSHKKQFLVAMVSRGKVRDIHHVRKPWWNMFKNRKKLVSISSLGGKKQLSEWKKSRSSRPEVFCQKGFLKISQNSQESTCTGVFFIRVTDLSFFHVNSTKFLRTPIF